MTKEEKIKEYLMKELYCPYGEDSNLDVALEENYDGSEVEEIQITTNTWEIDLGVRGDWFSFSTMNGCGIDEYELEYVMSIKDSREHLNELIKEEE